MTAPFACASAVCSSRCCPIPRPASTTMNVAPIRRLRFISRLLLRHELLHTLAVMLLARIDVALRIGRDAADREELTGVSPAAAERANLGQGVALEDVHLLVVTVGDEQVSLLRIVGKRDVPRGSVRRHD